jgi:hypothetical protein
MTDSGPLWLRVALALIPVLVAVIAGIFAINTVSSRIERLKNLVEIQKGIPQVFNQDYAVERVMIRELNAIEMSTTPWYIWYRRLSILASVVAYVYLARGWIEGHLFKLSGHEKNILGGAYTAVLLSFGASYWVWRKRLKEMRDRQKARLKLVDSLAASPERPETESPPTDADQSQANDAKATDATSDTDATSPRSGD